MNKKRTRYEETEEYLIMRQIEQEEQLLNYELQNKYYFNGGRTNDKEEDYRSKYNQEEY